MKEVLPEVRLQIEALEKEAAQPSALAKQGMPLYRYTLSMKAVSFALFAQCVVRTWRRGGRGPRFVLMNPRFKKDTGKLSYLWRAY